MSHWNAIRLKAAETRRNILEKAGRNPDELVSPQELVDLAAEHFDILVSAAQKDSPSLLGSVAVLSNGMIFFDGSLKDGYKQYCIAHEIGHHVLHRKIDKCSDSDIREFSSDDEAPTPVQEVQGYGSRERREREANLFALEFLLPLDVAKNTFLSQEGAFEKIKEVTKLSSSLIYSQLSTALFIPKAAITEDAPIAEVRLDESQSAAARADGGPLLLTAGPGTGKTQTLVQRILFLLNEKNVDPERILALTFSNKAAQEMRERIALSAPEAAPKMSVMTFHSYSLELLRKYWNEAGLKPDSELIERLDAIFYLEQHLDELDLEQFQVLENPPAKLPLILNAISRAKDELVSPEEFLAQVRVEESEAETEEDRLRIAELSEIGRVYEFYQKFLEETQQLDYGELIFKAVRLIQDNPEIKETLQRSYDAILVDEFQDINRASGVLVKEIAGDGKGLWAVGDLRQSIYRWRGASTANIKQFESDYPGTKKMSLDVNYRSGKEVVDMFSKFAEGMIAGDGNDFKGWNVSRTDGAQVHYHLASNLKEETNTIADEILENVSGGMRFKDQAVICRSNKQLNNIAERLVAKGIPVLFLGDIFDRPEIKDLMSFLEVRSSDRGFGLVRLTEFPEYRMSIEDVSSVMEACHGDGIDFQDFISGTEYPIAMSAEGRRSIDELRAVLTRIPREVSAFEALGRLLFREEKFIRRILSSGDDILRSQKLLAIFQVMNLAKTLETRLYKEEEKGEQIAKFINHIRRLIAFREDTIFSQVPETASELNAVRMLTVHKSKGLEFESVFLPYLGKGHFPSKEKDDGFPLPKNIPDADSEYMEEQECLFFVAMSRARKSLHLSRAQKYTSKGSSEHSLFLDKLGERLPPVKEVKGSEVNDDIADTELLAGYHGGDIFITEMNRYEDCPREFYYRHVRKLKGKKSGSVYQKFHTVVYQTIGDIQATLKKREVVDEAVALAKLDLYWQLGEMDSEPYSKIYRKRAEQMIRTVVSRIGNVKTEVIATSLTYAFELGSVTAKPDHLEMVSVEEGVLIRSFFTGKEPVEDKRLTVEDEEVLFLLAVEKQFHGAPVRIVRTYLSTDSDREVVISNTVKTNRIEKFNRNLEGIRAGRFPAKPSTHRCPKCPYFFICDRQ